MPAARRTLTPTREPMATQRPRWAELGRGWSGGGIGPAESGARAACVDCGVGAGVGAGGCAWVGSGVGAAPGRGVSGASMRVVSDEKAAAAAAGVLTAGAGVDDGAFPGTAVVRAGGSALTGTVFRAARRASADWKRFSGSLAMHIMMIWLSAGGRSLRRVIGGGGSVLSCAVMSAYCESVSNGSLPVSIS